MRLRNPNIMLIDDDSLYLELFKQELKNAQYSNVQAFDNPTEVFKSQTKVPDLVFVDFHMNEISGARVSKMVRKKWKKARIILISHSNSINHRIKKSRYGIDKTIVKTNDFKLMILEVRKSIWRKVIRYSLFILVGFALFIGVACTVMN